MLKRDHTFQIIFSLYKSSIKKNILVHDNKADKSYLYWVQNNYLIPEPINLAN